MSRPVRFSEVPLRWSVFGAIRALKMPRYMCAIYYSELHATPRFISLSRLRRIPAISGDRFRGASRGSYHLARCVLSDTGRGVATSDRSLDFYRYARDILYIHTRFTLTHGSITCHAFTEYSYMRADIVCTWRGMSQIQLGKFNFGASFDFSIYTCYSCTHTLHILFIFIHIHICNL